MPQRRTTTPIGLASIAERYGCSEYLSPSGAKHEAYLRRLRNRKTTPHRENDWANLLEKLAEFGNSLPQPWSSPKKINEIYRISFA